MNQNTPTPQAQQSFSKQFWSFTRTSEDLQKQARDLARQSTETRVNRLQLMQDHIKAGGNISRIQKNRLSRKEKAHVHLIELGQDPDVKEVIEDIRACVLTGLTGLEEGIQALIRKLKK